MAASDSQTDLQKLDNLRGGMDQVDARPEDAPAPTWKRALGRAISIGAVLAAIVTGSLCALVTVENPRTDDAEVFANFIGIAPQVDGPINHLYVTDNQYVKEGESLFEIDSRPYQYALQRALSEQAQLRGEIRDRERTVAAQQSAVIAAQASIGVSEANVNRAEHAVNAAAADVAAAQAAVDRAQAEWVYVNNNLHRLEPLLKRQFVTVDQVDRAHTQEQANAQAVHQAQAQATLANAQMQASVAALEQAKAQLQQSRAQERQSVNNVPTLEPYTAQKQARTSAVQRAEYDLNNTRIRAPFDARVTNLTISQGQYARIGAQVFTLIDIRYWWVIANFRETQLKHVRPGMPAEIYLMPQTNAPLAGTVESISYGVTPDPTLLGTVSSGLPNVQRTLNWVHLATRYPVRVRVNAPPPGLLRVGESAVVVVRGDRAPLDVR
ncbi:MAG TPA: HlyD family efflux transporter periplasmic adaptor subunit [Terriglobales bacterium]